ncbi:hypothetical protein V6Z98_004841 [Aspergillus fumigatus]
MAPHKVVEGSPTQQIISDHVWKRKRPETDYERWQREQDESYEPGGRPQYGPPNEFRKDDYVADGTEELLHGQHYSVEHRAPSHGYFVSSTAPAKPITSEGSFISYCQEGFASGRRDIYGQLTVFRRLVDDLFRGIKVNQTRLSQSPSPTVGHPGQARTRRQAVILQDLTTRLLGDSLFRARISFVSCSALVSMYGVMRGAS